MGKIEADEMKLAWSKKDRVRINLSVFLLIGALFFSNSAYAAENIWTGYSTAGTNLSPKINFNAETFEGTFFQGVSLLADNRNVQSISESLARSLPWSTFGDFFQGVNVTSKNLLARWQDYIEAADKETAVKALANVERVISELDRKIFLQKGDNPRNGNIETAMRADCWIRNQYAAEALKQVLPEEDVKFVNAGQSRGTYGYYHAFVLFKIGSQWFVLDAAADQFETRIADSNNIGLVVLPAGKGDIAEEISGEIFFLDKLDLSWAFSDKLLVAGKIGILVYGSGTMRAEKYDPKITDEVNAKDYSREQKRNFDNLASTLAFEISLIKNFFDEGADGQLRMIGGLTALQIAEIKSNIELLLSAISQVPSDILDNDILLGQINQTLRDFELALQLTDGRENGFFMVLGEGYDTDAISGYQTVDGFLKNKNIRKDDFSEEDFRDIHQMISGLIPAFRAIKEKLANQDITAQDDIRAVFKILGENLGNTFPGLLSKLSQGVEITQPDIDEVLQALGYEGKEEGKMQFNSPEELFYFSGQRLNMPRRYRQSPFEGIEGFWHPVPARIQGLMEDLARWLSAELKVIDGLVPAQQKDRAAALAAKMHYLLVLIHPFSDGNGRIARQSVNYILSRYGFELVGETRNVYDERIQLDRKNNFGAEKKSVNLQSASWEYLLSLNTPNFQEFLLEHMRENSFLVEGISNGAEFLHSVFIQDGFEMIQIQVVVEQAI